VCANEKAIRKGIMTETARHRVLLISTEPLYENLAGPGIRTVQMATYLAPHCQLTLAAPRQGNVSLPGVECVVFQRDDHTLMQQLASQAEVIILQGFTLYHHSYLATMGKKLVIDLYDPFHLECLEFFKEEEEEHARQIHAHKLHVVDQQLQVGDFFICASERQRDFWLGALSSTGRLSPESYAQDPSFRSLIDVVPFGLEPTPPTPTNQVLKGVVPGIGKDDQVILWGGGVWDWLDPLTVIRAMAHVREQRGDVKLFFLGFHHPNPEDVPKMRVYEKCLELVKELDLADTVLFNDSWVPYRERHNYLLEADIGVSANFNHLETRYAFRTRMLDYIWAGLPMVITAGDTLADTVAAHGLGLVVCPGDPLQFGDALLTLLDQPDLRQLHAPAFAAIQPLFVWENVLQPLITFCQNPYHAADHKRLTLSDTYQRRIEELDDIVAKKNDHIAYLESLIKQVESGRIMQALRLFNDMRQGQGERFRRLVWSLTKQRPTPVSPAPPAPMPPAATPSASVPTPTPTPALTPPAPTYNILDEYVTDTPTPQHALDIFKDEWWSKLPEPYADLTAGKADIFEDERIEMALEELGGVAGKSVLELGPLEGGHSYMLERAGAESILAIESNTRAYLKCLVVKELFHLQRVQFACGDFVSYMRDTDTRFDVCIACGVLYHMPNPVELIALLAKTSDRIFLWTHYYDEEVIASIPGLINNFYATETVSYQDATYTVHRQEYRASLSLKHFSGGMESYSYWMYREDILDSLRHFGYTSVNVLKDYQGMHGPSFSVVAIRE
jgi:glycosyltransferase involved in cell wall biosynthesis